MKHRYPILLLTLLLAGCAGLPLGREARVLDADEVHRLFTDRTVESYNRNTGLTSFTYYRPDGRVLQRRFWSWRSGSWRVRPDGRICLKFRTERCRRIVAEGDRYYKIAGRDPQAKRLVRYRQFLPGNHIAPPGGRWPRGPVFRP